LQEGGIAGSEVKISTLQEGGIAGLQKVKVSMLDGFEPLSP
jgi:hypothetical protein